MDEIRCVRCVLSTSFPGIELDKDGVCNFCRDEILDMTDSKSIEAAKIELEGLISSTKSTSEYDAILCYSGGKDSSYTLLKAKRDFGLNILAFTFDNGFISQTAKDNIRRVVDALGVDHIYFKPSVNVFAKIMKASLCQDLYARSTARRISSGCQSCIWMVNNLALKLALEKDTPLILAGFTIGQIPIDGLIYKNNYEFLMESRKRPLSIIVNQAGAEAQAYLSIPARLIPANQAYPHTINLLCLEDISEEEIISQIKELGWEAPQDVDGCSSNCRLNVLNNHAHKLRFGFNPYELELSHLVRRGQLSRNQAIDKMNDQSTPLLKEVLAQLHISDSDLPRGKTTP